MAFEVTGNPGPNVQRALKEYQRVIAREVTAIALETERTAKQNVTDLEKVDRGLLRNSIDSDIQLVGDAVEGIVFVGVKHGPWVEFGRHGSKSSPVGTGKDSAKPAFPPVKEIREWVRRNNKKFAVSGRTKSGKARTAKDADLDAAAFLIARKIAEHGIAPSPYLVPAFMESAPNFRPRIARAMKGVKLK